MVVGSRHHVLSEWGYLAIAAALFYFHWDVFTSLLYFVRTARVLGFVLMQALKEKGNLMVADPDVKTYAEPLKTIQSYTHLEHRREKF